MKQLEQLLDIQAQMTKDMSAMSSIGNTKDSRAVSVFIARKYAQLLTELADEVCPRKTRNRKKKRRASIAS